MMNFLSLATMIGVISAAKQSESTCRINSLVAYMDEGCTIPYRSLEATKSAREEMDRFNEASLYSTGQCYNYTAGQGSIVI